MTGTGGDRANARNDRERYLISSAPKRAVPKRDSVVAGPRQLSECRRRKRRGGSLRKIRPKHRHQVAILRRDVAPQSGVDRRLILAFDLQKVRVLRRDVFLDSL